VTSKTKPKQKGIVIIILHDREEIWNSLNKINAELPLILSSSESNIYILIKDIPKAMSDFIQTGKSPATELRVLTESQEHTLHSLCQRHGFKVTYHQHQIEYMHRIMTIIYPKVQDRESGVKICLIPWFMLPGRPYPVYLYIYAIWHYHASGKKSLEQSAASAAKIFGIEKLSKSTVSRNIKAMEDFIEISRVDHPLSVEELRCPRVQELFEYIPEILKSSQPTELLEEKYGKKIKPAPELKKQIKSVASVLSGVPLEYSAVIKASGTAKVKTCDNRLRPVRPRKKRNRRVQRRPDFIDSQQIEEIRRSFIAVCRNLVLCTAVKYHQFLV